MGWENGIFPVFIFWIYNSVDSIHVPLLKNIKQKTESHIDKYS